MTIQDAFNEVVKRIDTIINDLNARFSVEDTRHNDLKNKLSDLTKTVADQDKALAVLTKQVEMLQQFTLPKDTSVSKLQKKHWTEAELRPMEVDAEQCARCVHEYETGYPYNACHTCTRLLGNVMSNFQQKKASVK
jgi:hypothetical protein